VGKAGSGTGTNENTGDRKNREPVGEVRGNTASEQRDRIANNQKERLNRVQVEIFGQKYNIIGGENIGRIQDIANIVDSQMKEIAGQNKGISALKISILAALNITDQMLQFQEKNSTFIKKGENLLSLLKEAVED